MSRKKKNNGQQGVINHIQTPQARTSGVSAVYEKLALYSLLVPIAISIIFLLSEIIGLTRFSPNELTLDVIMPMTISYITPTVFSASIFMVLQQFILLVPAGFDAKKGVLLFGATFVFGALYAAYLSGNQPLPEQIGISVLTIAFFIVNICSLQTGKRRLDIGLFSG